ncbi:MAG: extracellular solute-binding protein [Firmicutes bacterium]|nr:extracellular solute-binding protein [Bacillota bacterium]
MYRLVSLTTAIRGSKRLILLAVLVMLLVGVASVAPVGAAESWWAQVAKPYRGTVITGISESTPPSKYMQQVLAPAFEKETGIRVKFEVTSWDQMYDKEIKDMEAGTGVYDFVYIEQDIIYAYLQRNFLVDLTKFMEEKPNLVYPDLDMGDFTSFINYFKDADTGHLYGLPFESFLKFYLYRKDLFEDPKIKAEFKEKYGWDLRPATTFKEYEQIAEFFTDYGKRHKMDLWGTTVQAGSHPAAFYEMVETIWPSWGIYNWGINTKTWRSSMAQGGMLDSPRSKEALRWWVSMLKYAPPEATSSTWDEVAASMAAGRAAQGWVYGENTAWIATDPKRSKVVGKIGVALPPLYPGVQDDAAKGKGYIGYYDGGALGIPHSSRNKEAALLFLQWVTRKEFQGDFAAASARIVRKSTFDDPKVRALDPKVDSYFTKMKKYGPLFAGAPPFPFHATIREVILPFVLKAISGELTPEAALDQAAKAVDAELARLGYGKGK